MFNRGQDDGGSVVQWPCKSRATGLRKKGICIQVCSVRLASASGSCRVSGGSVRSGVRSSDPWRQRQMSVGIESKIKATKK